MIIFLKNELLKWQGGVRGPRTLGQPWAPQHGDPALAIANHRQTEKDRQTCMGSQSASTVRHSGGDGPPTLPYTGTRLILLQCTKRIFLLK